MGSKTDQSPVLCSVDASDDNTQVKLECAEHNLSFETHKYLDIYDNIHLLKHQEHKNCIQTQKAESEKSSSMNKSDQKTKVQCSDIIHKSELSVLKNLHSENYLNCKINKSDEVVNLPKLDLNILGNKCFKNCLNNRNERFNEGLESCVKTFYEDSDQDSEYLALKKTKTDWETFKCHELETVNGLINCIISSIEETLIGKMEVDVNEIAFYTETSVQDQCNLEQCQGKTEEHKEVFKGKKTLPQIPTSTKVASNENDLDAEIKRCCELLNYEFVKTKDLEKGSKNVKLELNHEIKNSNTNTQDSIYSINKIPNRKVVSVLCTKGMDLNTETQLNVNITLGTEGNDPNEIPKTEVCFETQEFLSNNSNVDTTVSKHKVIPHKIPNNKDLQFSSNPEISIDSKDSINKTVYSEVDKDNKSLVPISSYCEDECLKLKPLLGNISNSSKTMFCDMSNIPDPKSLVNKNTDFEILKYNESSVVNVMQTEKYQFHEVCELNADVSDSNMHEIFAVDEYEISIIEDESGENKLEVSTIEEYEVSVIDIETDACNYIDADNGKVSIDENDSFISICEDTEKENGSECDIKSKRSDIDVLNLEVENSVNLQSNTAQDELVIVYENLGKNIPSNIETTALASNLPTNSRNLERNKENLTNNYEEDESKDIQDPGWETVKQLSTNEERYQQVKNCWKSLTVPDPNKNLTYHSYRKRRFLGAPARVTKQHKRLASNNLNEHNAKRPRSCTHIYDDQIRSINVEKRKQKDALMQEMNNKLTYFSNLAFQEEVKLNQNFNPYGHMGHQAQQLYNLQTHFQRQLSSITNEYERKANQCQAKLQDGIEALYQARNEVLQFYSFYKGLKTMENDPTVLTTPQLQELDEIENVYSQFNKFYK